MSTTVAIIPCRYQSSRFPGKPLADIGGKPMMWHVYDAAKRAREIDAVFIATDDNRIEAACKSYGMGVLRTGNHHFTGTDRLTECLDLVRADFFVNVQGDEPMINPEAIASVALAMEASADPAILATNGYSLFESDADVASNNVVKVVLTASNRALSYSRHPVPFARGATPVFRRQLGLYCFSRRGLELFAELKPGPVETAESVEMLRFIEHDHSVLMVEVDDRSVPVDTEADLKRVRLLMSDHGKKL